MHRVFGSLIMGALVIYSTLYAWNHRAQLSSSPVAQEAPPEVEAKPDVPPQDQPYISITGPLAGYVAKNSPQATTPKPVSHYLTAEDHIEASPVGSSSQIVKKTFPMARTVQFSFEIPAHAATPKVHGTFRSFVQQGLGPSADDSASNINVLLMNERQYAEFSSGREPDVLFITDPSHYQDINFELSPSQNQPVKYHLIFRSAPGTAPRKVVQADVAVDF